MTFMSPAAIASSADFWPSTENDQDVFPGFIPADLNALDRTRAISSLSAYTTVMFLPWAWIRFSRLTF